MDHDRRISVIGLGYVGLPVAVAFGLTGAPVVAFDISRERLDALRRHTDRTLEVTVENLRGANLLFTDRAVDLRQANFHIVAVPTPITRSRRPDLGPLLEATRIVGEQLEPGDIVVYESTVYPGATEEECVPLLERTSGLRLGADFGVGYSPERINPGDRDHRFETITKVVSGSDPPTLDVVARVYGSVVRAGIHRAPSIRTAEAAKVIENTQRDLNIALMNELALIFARLGLDSHDVLEAAATKWNFLRFSPGLVGGHCIGVDPYYLTYRAEIAGYHPQVILAGRRINDGMGHWIAQQAIKTLLKEGGLAPCTVTVLGITFKENVPDHRNTRVVDMVAEFRDFGARVQVHDPLADRDAVAGEYGIELTDLEALAPAHAVVVAVPHGTYREGSWGLVARLLEDSKGLVVDVRGCLDRNRVPDGIRLWRL